MGVEFSAWGRSDEWDDLAAAHFHLKSHMKRHKSCYRIEYKALFGRDCINSLYLATAYSLKFTYEDKTTPFGIQYVFSWRRVFAVSTRWTAVPQRQTGARGSAPAVLQCWRITQAPLRFPAKGIKTEAKGLVSVRKGDRKVSPFYVVFG